MYSYIKKILFSLDPERAHHLTLASLKCAYRLKINPYAQTIPAKPRTVMNITFPNPIGLAAGLDKNGEYIDALASLGFGFIEIGTITPKPQEGNPRPRLFRLNEEQALINRMGFNNKGIEYATKQLEKTYYRGVLGINIGKNKDTTLDHAIDDYLLGMRAFWRFASYLTINISSPNTQGLRDLQESAALTSLLSRLKQEQATLTQEHHKYVPLALKLSPDLSQEACEEIATILIQQQIDGVILTNTTIHRDEVATSSFANETGGLSGKPLFARSTHITKIFHELLQDRIPIIAVGGIRNDESAREKYKAGATLLQIYTGLIYQGPTLIKTLASLL